jgi:hypothetical protein
MALGQGLDPWHMERVFLALNLNSFSDACLLSLWLKGIFDFFI